MSDVAQDDRVNVKGVGEGYIALVAEDTVSIEFTDADSPSLTVPKEHIGTDCYELVETDTAPAVPAGGDGYGGSETEIVHGATCIQQWDRLRDTETGNLVTVKEIKGRRVTVVDVAPTDDGQYLRRPSTKRTFDWPRGGGRFIPVDD